VAPDVAGEIARRLNVPVKYLPFKSPGELADQAVNGVWDIGLIGAEPQRAETIALPPPIPRSKRSSGPFRSPLATIAEVDAAGVRIAVTGRTA